MISICWVVTLALMYILSLVSGVAFLQINLFVFIPAILVSFILVLLSVKNFSFTAPKDFTFQKDNEFVIPLEIKNKGIIPFSKVLCQIDGENKLTGESFKNYVDCAIGPKKSNTIKINFSSENCGKIELKYNKIYFYDFFGIFHKSVDVNQLTSITILPKTFGINIYNKIEKETPEDSNEFSSKKPGSDMSEIFQIREYRNGDSLKQIHWKLSDKFGTLMTKEASLPVENSVCIMFDTINPFGDYGYYDAGAEVLTSLSSALLDQGVSHKIIWKDSNNLIKTANINSTEELSLSLFSILDGHSTDNVSVIEEYLGENGTLDASYVVAICCAEPCTIDSKLEMNVSVLCGYKESIPEEYKDKSALYYDIDNYEESLANLIL